MRYLMICLIFLGLPTMSLADRKVLPASICQFWPGDNADQQIASTGEQVKGTGRGAMAVSQFGHVANSNNSDTRVLGLVCPLIRDKPDKDYLHVWVYGHTDDCHDQSNTTGPCHSNARAASTCIVRSRDKRGRVRQVAKQNLNREVETSEAGPKANLVAGWTRAQLAVLDREAAVFVFCELGRDVRLDTIHVEEER